MRDLSPFYALQINELEKVLSERLAIKTSEFAGNVKSKKYDFIPGPLAKEWDKILYKNKEVEHLHQLRELLATVKEAKKASIECSEAIQQELEVVKDNFISDYCDRFADFSEQDSDKKASNIYFFILDFIKKVYTPTDTDTAIYKANQDK